MLPVLVLVCILSSAPAPDPYSQGLATVTSRDEIETLLSIGLELKPGGQRGQVRVIGRASDLRRASEAGIGLELEIADLEAWAAAQMSGRGDFGAYYTYAEAVAKMNELHTLYPTVTTEPEAIGTSGEGNALWAMKVSDNPLLEEDEPEILFSGVHHAREPIGCTLCLDFIEYLAAGYGVDPLCTYFIDERQIWFIPVVNPDGYLYNELTNPNGGGYWRKNRRSNGDGSFGVDLNRNYTFQWGYDNIGSSPYTSDETYRGPGAGSEPEVQALMAFCRLHDFVASQHWHSYSNYLLYPWGYADILTPDDPAFDAQAAEATAGIGYATGTAWELLYNTNGDANDWGYGDTSKPKIFSCTAEVGESFWQESAIPAHIVEGRQVSVTQTRFAGPLPAVQSSTVDDAGGNGNGRLDPGETASIVVTMVNKGFHGTDAVTASVLSSDPFLQIQTSTLTFAPFPALGTAVGIPSLEVTVDPNCPVGWASACSLAVAGTWVYPDTIVLPITVGRPAVLVVDSDNEPTETRLMDAIARAPIAVDTWYLPGQGSVSLELLRLYRAVIWTAGDQNASSIPSADRQALSQYLDLGGALLLSAENYLTSYGSDPFTSTYLHVGSYTTSIDVSTVAGVTGDPVTDGMSLAVSFPGALSDTPDAIVPDALAAGILRVNGGSTLTALRYPGTGPSTYRVVFTATPLEAMVAGQTALEDLVQAMVSWLLQSSDATSPSVPASLAAVAGPGPGQATLTWAPSTDNIGVLHYRIYEDSSTAMDPLPSLLLDIVTAPPFVRTIALPEPGRGFWMVTAMDAGGNESAPSGPVGGVAYPLETGP